MGASTEWPGIEPDDVEIGDLGALAEKYPAVPDELRAIPVSVRTVPPTRFASRRNGTLHRVSEDDGEKDGSEPSTNAVGGLPLFNVASAISVTARTPQAFLPPPHSK